MKKLRNATALAAMTLLSSPLVVFADVTANVSGSTYQVEELLTKGLNWATIIAGIAALGYLIYAGVKYVSSSGDPGKVEEAQKQIVSALIGLAIVILAFTIVNLVLNLFGTGDLSQLKLPSLTPE